VAVCFTCATFATWNAWPSMMASLATGNAVIVKPHPTSVLPMAHSVRAFRRVLREAGFDPNLVTMLTDSSTEPVGKVLVQHPKTAIVDFTGSARFGQWVERHAHPALVYTETSGVNTVVIESAADLDAALRSLATTMCMFSAQMCTSPQNVYLPRTGVRTPQGTVPMDEVAQRLAAAIDAVGRDPRRAGMILAAIQSPATLAQLAQWRDEGARAGRVLLEPRPYPHPEFPDARTSTPLLVQTDTAHRALYGEERFGPAGFVIACADAADALAQATADAREFGGLTAFLYSEDEAYVERAVAAYARAGAQLTINLTGPMPLNFAAAYSDVHVTGLNPAGNASLTDLAFVAGRFRITQSRRPARDA
jgi:phenylacetic acid degradation protein paaN